MLDGLCDTLRTQGVALRLAEVHAATRDLLRAQGLEAKVGGIDRFTSVADAVDGHRIPPASG
jgi:hypothetical protein